MRLLGNIIWIIFGGFFAALGWFFLGLIFCITIIGIPLGRQCFKFGELMLLPFGREVKTHFEQYQIINILWAIFVGWWMALGYIVAGIFYCITIIGIPFGLQWFKFAKLAFTPFGATLN